MFFVDEQLKKKIEELERSEGFVQVIFNDATKEEREKINQVIEECLQQRMEKVESKLNSGEYKEDEDDGITSPFFIDTQGADVNESEIQVDETVPEETKNQKSSKPGMCFNCGGDHKLINCPYPHDEETIRRNVQIFQESTASETRYYKAYDDDKIKIGEISEELRNALGIKRNEPPPYIERMHKYGYPPGYLTINRDTLSNLGTQLKIYNDEHDQGEDHSKSNETEITKKKSLPVCTCYATNLHSYPGFNAPIPEGADPKQWPKPYESNYCLVHGYREKVIPHPEDANKTIEELEADRDNEVRYPTIASNDIDYSQYQF